MSPVSHTAFAGVDPDRNESGQKIPKSEPTSKKGSPSLRKALFQIMDSLIKCSSSDDAVYAFMDNKRTQGKPLLCLYDCWCKHVHPHLLWAGKRVSFLPSRNGYQRILIQLNFPVKASILWWSCFWAFNSTCIKFSKLYIFCLTFSMQTTTGSDGTDRIKFFHITYSYLKRSLSRMTETIFEPRTIFCLRLNLVRSD